LNVKVITEIREIKVPNIFTPNGDGVNDHWLIQFLNTYANCRVQVFNRYGQKVFESTGYNNPWDGKFNNQPLPFGTYYYIIALRKGMKSITGYVTIVR
jgi:gliding motility-associated-like protein